MTLLDGLRYHFRDDTSVPYSTMDCRGRRVAPGSSFVAILKFPTHSPPLSMPIFYTVGTIFHKLNIKTGPHQHQGLFPWFYLEHSALYTNPTLPAQFQGWRAGLPLRVLQLVLNRDSDLVFQFRFIQGHALQVALEKDDAFGFAL